MFTNKTYSHTACFGSFLTPAQLNMDIYGEIQDKLHLNKLQEIPNSAAKGCISSGQGFHTNNGDIFVKINTNEEALPMFFGEMNSLIALRRTNTIYAPEPLCIAEDPKSNGGAIVLEYLNMGAVTEWTKLGSQLADLHLFNSVLKRKKGKLSGWIGKPPKGADTSEADMTIEKEIKLQIDNDLVDEMEYVDQFGFEGTTYCGRIAQNNEWHNDWVEFYARNKLDCQISMVVQDSGDRQVVEYWSELQLKLHRLFADVRGPIEPALLHGDLWSGNVSQAVDRPVIYDPASFYGHSEFELSIATLFGGFSSAFYQEYFRKIPKQKGYEMRNELYKLFHTLNHWNHFGSHKRQTKDIMKKLIQHCSN